MKRTFKKIKRVMNAIEDKVFLVTGGANGVGAGLARALLIENARHVAFVDVAQREGSALESELNNNFGALRAKFIKCDIANEDELSEAFKQVLDKYSRLDVVINNAAILATDENAHKRMIDVNFVAAVNSTLKAMDLMSIDNGGVGGTIINISSLLALSQSPKLPVYSATKTAILQFSNCIGMATHYSRTQVKVLTVCFGPTDTAILHRHNFEKFDQDCDKSAISRSSHRQSIGAAVAGVLDIIRRGESGSTWVVADDKPALDITPRIKQAYELISNGIFDANDILP